MNAYHADKVLIDALGGPAEVAKKLGIDPGNGGIQKVWNWTRRGIPAAVRLKHYELFGPPSKEGEAA